MISLNPSLLPMWTHRLYKQPNWRLLSPGETSPLSSELTHTTSLQPTQHKHLSSTFWSNPFLLSSPPPSCLLLLPVHQPVVLPPPPAPPSLLNAGTIVFCVLGALQTAGGCVSMPRPAGCRLLGERRNYRGSRRHRPVDGVPGWRCGGAGIHIESEKPTTQRWKIGSININVKWKALSQQLMLLSNLLTSWTETC